MGTSFIGFRGRGFWARDGKLEVLLYLMASAAADRQAVEPWLAQATEHWRLQATAGFQGVVDPGLDGLIGSDPDRVDVLAELAGRVEQALRYRTVIAGADLAGAGVGGSGTDWPPVIDTADILPIATAMRDLFADRIAWHANNAPTL